MNCPGISARSDWSVDIPVPVNKDAPIIRPLVPVKMQNVGLYENWKYTCGLYMQTVPVVLYWLKIIIYCLRSKIKCIYYVCPKWNIFSFCHQKPKNNIDQQHKLMWLDSSSKILFETIYH